MRVRVVNFNADGRVLRCRYLDSGGLSRRRIQGIHLEPEGRSRGRVCVYPSLHSRLYSKAPPPVDRFRGKAVASRVRSVACQEVADSADSAEYCHSWNSKSGDQ